jgi:hypothetical protein
VHPDEATTIVKGKKILNRITKRRKGETHSMAILEVANLDQAEVVAAFAQVARKKHSLVERDIQILADLLIAHSMVMH